MSKKTVLLIIGGCVSVMIAFLLILNSFGPQIPLKYEKNVVRDFSSQEEEKALAVAESTSYSSIVSRERFAGSSDPEAYLHPGLYMEYTYANFVDSTVLNYL